MTYLVKNPKDMMKISLRHPHRLPKCCKSHYNNKKINKNKSIKVFTYIDPFSLNKCSSWLHSATFCFNKYYINRERKEYKYYKGSTFTASYTKTFYRENY